MRSIIFAEPSTFNSKNKWVKQRSFQVTDEFYKVLLKKPKAYKSYGSNVSNAYIFGKKYDLKDYKKIRTHGNDAAQTGLIDKKLWKDGAYNEVVAELNKKFAYTYDSAQNVRQVRKLTNGGVIFQGETIGGDIGADLYAHYNASKNIDSLIIDNFYFYPSPPTF
jgi:hypothetical protein